MRTEHGGLRVMGDWVRDVSVTTLRADLLAGLLGAVLVLPQAIAFAALAGLPPQMGLYTAVVPCIVAALAGSRTRSPPRKRLTSARTTPYSSGGGPKMSQAACCCSRLSDWCRNRSSPSRR